ncbi:MAG TPA: hypothetical protein VJC18_01855, partial [bacterium]|nr:hypothetical protein [bacterium]
ESESSGADTFVFFDGFDAASIDTSKWTQANVLDDFNVVDGKLVLGAGTSSFNQALYTTSAFARSNLVMEFDYTWTSANTSYDAIMMGWKDDGTGRTQTNLVYAHYNAGASTCTVNCTGYVFEDGTSRSGVTSKYTQNQPYRLRLSMKTEGGATYQQSSDAGQTWSTVYNSVHSTESNLHPGFVLHSGTHVIDNVRVRPWTSTEPTVSIDAEVSQYSAVSGTLLSSVYDTGEAGCAVESIAHTVSDTGLVEIRLRSANAPNMSDATDFSACDAIDGSTSFTAYPCVQAHDRYLQYQLVLGTEEDLGPTLTDITINYDSLSLQANAGEDRIVAAGRAITLDGLASTGIDLSYAWAVFEGEGVLADEFTATPTLTIPAGAQRSQTSVTLTVYDAYGQHASDEVTLSILGTPTLSLAENKLA